jgi:chemotaxis protein methyltransferase CheR
VSGPPLKEDEFRMWSEWLEEEYGLRFGPEKRTMLRTRLEPRRAALGVDSYEQLLFHLKFNPSRGAERERLLPHLTNNESYFCRELGSLEVIRDELLPALRATLPPGGPVRLLSAACSTGEEAYTLAILALQAGLGAGGFRVTGVDVDGVVLARARAGRYGPHAFRGTDDAFRRRWFVEHGEAWEVRPEVRAAVAFAPANLADPAWARGLPPQHVVLCRNVLIYFGDAAVERAARGLYDALAPGGCLFLGHAESLRHVPLPLRFERRPGALFYRRERDA